ncbi:MAG TPA: TOMM precursor leader peptide-binding protein [Mycobacteriales bacterium]|nr:TOMM precursor leader peptide-binding protein [Mycobacteriales bacterium]
MGFKKYLRPEVVAGEATYLFSEHGVTAVQGAEIEALTPLLDGTRDLPTLLREAPSGVSTERVAELTRRLADAGLVTERFCTAEVDDATLAYWELAGLDGAAAESTVAAGRVRVISTGLADGTDVVAACRAAGLRVVGDPAGATSPGATGPGAAGGMTVADLSVVLCDDYLAPELAEVDALHRAAGRAWLLAKPAGAQLWVGPFFQPGQGACWSCLAHRMWNHRRAEAHVQTALDRVGPAPRPAPRVRALGGLAAQLIVLEVVKWLAGHRHPSQQSIWTLDSLSAQGRHHPLRARPQCRSCGDPGLVAARARRPVAFSSRPKAIDDDGGGYRSMTPRQVLATYRHLIDPVTGVVTDIRRDPRGPAFLNSFRAGVNLAAGARNLADLRAGLRSENGGKGVTELHGTVSALCEALERHSGCFHGDEERVRASFAALGEPAVHPNACQLYDQRQHAGRYRWNAAHSPFQRVCEPFDETAEVDWTPVWSVTGRRHRLLPTALLYFGAPQPGPRYFRADSNGNAAGSSLEDAVLQGFFELVERDAVALWWYNRTRHPAVDLGSFADPWAEELREVYAGLRREVWVLDVTADLEIPTMVALSRRTDKPAEDILFGFGAHVDPRVALRRALTELNQLLPAVVGARPDGCGYGCTDPEALRWWHHATTANQPYLLPDHGQPLRTRASFGYLPRRDLRADLTAVEELVARHGLELLVLDQTRPDIGLPVVKVIVPGLRQFWARFAPGRLYEVPVRLGRLAAPTPYEELNPVPIFV